MLGWKSHLHITIVLFRSFGRRKEEEQVFRSEEELVLSHDQLAFYPRLAMRPPPHTIRWTMLFGGSRSRLISLNCRRVGGVTSCILNSTVFPCECCPSPSPHTPSVARHRPPTLLLFSSSPTEERVLKTERWEDWGRQESVEVGEANAMAAAEAVKDEERESAGTNKIKFSQISRLIEPRARVSKPRFPCEVAVGGAGAEPWGRRRQVVTELQQLNLCCLTGIKERTLPAPPTSGWRKTLGFKCLCVFISEMFDFKELLVFPKEKMFSFVRHYGTVMCFQLLSSGFCFFFF